MTQASIRQCPLSRRYKNGGLQAWLPLINHIATLSGLRYATVCQDTKWRGSITGMMRTLALVLRVASVPVGVGIGFWTALVTKGSPCPNHFNGALSSICPQFPVATFALWQCALFGAGAEAVVLLLSLAVARLPSARSLKTA